MNFDFSEVATNNTPSYYIKPGVSVVDIINNVTWNAPEGNNSYGQPYAPYFEVEMKLPEASDEQSTKFKFYMSEKKMATSMAQLKQLCECVTTTESINQSLKGSGEEIAQALTSILSGNRVRMQFNSEEYQNKSGEYKTKAVIPGTSYFCECVQDGAQKPNVSAANSKLKYSPSDPRQNKTLPRPDAEQTTSASTTTQSY